jgi:pseudouridylate synthase
VTFAPQLTDEIAEALRLGRPVVALETTLVSHGFSAGRGLAAALDSEQRVRAAGATPATIGVLDGVVRVGLSASELTRFAEAGASARKAGARDLAACVVQGALGSTTVGGTLAVCRAVGIRFVGTGGIGGVHRGFAETLDISADLPQLTRTPAVVVCSGAKSILDVPATAELLETLGVPVLGWQTSTLPMFYSAEGGPPVSAIVTQAAEAARIAATHWELVPAGGLILARPPAGGLDLEALVTEAVARVRRAGVTGQAVTPAVLAAVEDLSDGRSVEVNRRLIADNAELAARVAVAYAGLSPQSTMAATGPPPSGP